MNNLIPVLIENEKLKKKVEAYENEHKEDLYIVIKKSILERWDNLVLLSLKDDFEILLKELGYLWESSFAGYTDGLNWREVVNTSYKLISRYFDGRMFASLGLQKDALDILDYVFDYYLAFMQKVMRRNIASNDTRIFFNMSPTNELYNHLARVKRSIRDD